MIDVNKVLCDALVEAGFRFECLKKPCQMIMKALFPEWKHRLTESGGDIS